MLKAVNTFSFFWWHFFFLQNCAGHSCIIRTLESGKGTAHHCVASYFIYFKKEKTKKLKRYCVSISNMILLHYKVIT